MKFIIEENCHNIKVLDAISPYIKIFLDELLKKKELTSLDYFVIADSEGERYSETVKKYAAIIGTEAGLTQDEYYSTVGKSLRGLDQNGNLHQAIVIDSLIWEHAAYEYMNIMKISLEEFPIQKFNDKSLPLVIHEIGHIIDNEIQYKMFGTINTKITYDLRYEYDEYVKQMALSLWGEYYAEAFAYQIIQAHDDITLDMEKELINCINHYSLGTNSNALWERVYRILYYFVIRLAFIHHYKKRPQTFDYATFKQIDVVSDYIPFLARTELAIINLYSDYPKWGTSEQLNELSFIINDFFTFERERQQENR